jgi:hypothetical protein
MTTTTDGVEVIQKKGFYQIETPSGAKAKLTRVTTALDWVIKEGFGGMSYYGGKLFARFLADSDEEFEQFYVSWKQSEFDPNRTLRERATRGTAAHELFEKLLKGEATAVREGDDYFVGLEDDIPFLAVGFDRGVVEAFLDVYAADTTPVEDPLSEVRLWWTEHPIDECPAPDKKGFCTHGFSGTCDVYFPHWAIDDLKTHKSGYRWSEYLQMALYSLAAQQLYGADITRQRIVLAHDEPGEDGKFFEVQDDRFLSADAGRLIWDLFKYRKDWGPKE